jgi:hypothetical protein
VLDTITAYMGGRLDMSQANQVRSFMAPLGRVAADHSVAVVPIGHTPKSTPRKAVYSALGSVDFGAAARSVLVAGRDPDDPQNRALAQAKNNLGPEAPSLSYSLVSGQFTWGKESDLTVADLFAPDTGQHRPGPAAEQMLREMLEAGPVRDTEIKRRAKSEELSWRTVRRAKDRLGIQVTCIYGEGGKRGKTGSMWALPSADGAGSAFSGQHAADSEVDTKSDRPPDTESGDDSEERVRQGRLCSQDGEGVWLPPGSSVGPDGRIEVELP